MKNKIFINEQEFIEINGQEDQRVTKDFNSKALAQNYSLADSVKEFIDNGYDARYYDNSCLIDIKNNTEDHIIVIEDDGSGIADDESLYTLGGTTKTKGTTIGKFGIGFSGATAATAKYWQYNKNEIVQLEIKSARDGKELIKNVAFTPDGRTIIGKSKYNECDNNLHYTRLTFYNAEIQNPSEIIEALEVTYEETFKKGLVIKFNGRQLGLSKRPTFTGEEIDEVVYVDDIPVKVRHRIIGGENATAEDRAFDETALRIYDETTGRLLGMEKEYWKWFGPRSSQQNICGVRAGIFIPSTMEAYNKFGIKSTKNGVNYKLYGNKPEFKNLSEKIGEIYSKASHTGGNTACGIYTKGKRQYQVVKNKMAEVYKEIGENSYIVKYKLSEEEIVNLIDTIITLESKLKKKSK